MKRLIIIPTYDEKANIEKLINDIQLQNIENLDILIIDDNSPDGTGKIIKNLQKENDNIFIIEREDKLGLGTAYIRGFKYALENNYDQIAQMDADYSHDPKDLIKLFKAVEKYDWAIGSRYKSGINVVNWPLSRLILSYGANIYSRIITGMKIQDGTAGFKCWNKNVLAKIKLDEVKSHGYSFQIEMNFRAWKAGFKFFEVPIVFTDRTLGESKMSKKIVREAIFMVWKLKYWSITKKI
jgi:dolichol-phosphate mannosyltransferase